MGGELRTIYGLKPVLEALEASADAVRGVFLAQGLEGPLPRKLRGLAESHGIVVRSISRNELERRCGSEHHQGVLATLASAPQLELEDLLRPGEKDLVLVADGVQDPRNLGALMRATQFWGGLAVVVPRHGASGLTGTVSKASAGATERLPLVTVTNLSRALESFKEAGYWTYGASADGGERLDRVRFNGPTVLVLGSEGKGIRPLVARHCDQLVTIPRMGPMESLNVANAAAVMLWEVRRQQEAESRGPDRPPKGRPEAALDNA